MHCRTAHENLIARELGLLSDRRVVLLERHLDSCAACTALARREERLSADLVALRVEIDRPVDVGPRVLAEVERIGPIAAGAARARSLGWAAAAALAGIAVGATGLRVLATDLAPPGPEGLTLLSGLRHAAAGVLEPVLAFLGAVLVLAGNLLRAAPVVLRSVESTGSATLVLASLLMMVTILTIVGRDLARVGATTRGTPR